MRLINTEEARVHRKIIGKVQSCRLDATGQRRSQGLLQVARPKGQKRFRIGEEEPRAYFIRAAAEFAVPVSRELVIRIFSRLTDGELPSLAGRARDSRDQEPARTAPKLVALKIEQSMHHGIDGRRCVPKEGLGNGSIRAIRR